MVSALRAEATRPVRLRTGDLDEARQIIEQNFYSNVVDLLQPSAVLRGHFAVSRLRGVTLGTLQFGADLRMRFGELGAYHVDIPLSGSMAWHQGRHDPLLATVDEAAVFQPGRTTMLDRWSGDCRLLAVKIERPALELQLERLLDAPIRLPLRLHPSMDVSHGPGRSWARLARWAAEDALTPRGLIGQELMADPLHEALLNGLLLAAHHPYREELTRPVAPSRPAPIKRAIDAMEAHPEHPFTVTALAEISGVGIRRLQQGFRQHVGMSPMDYLRRTRLARAHEELRAKETGQATVTDVAYRWGFTHLGRFAGAYRQRYGVTPSTTLAETRP
ncbi:AraC family transcriptional regulator [Streptomyces kunmingensis]|uniref:AraC family transcriptional regulator n=1 Tax=Streptomyces kunmingensis TaxID=68225 RepID=A0ABU6CHX8_9ACTN|nr:AraC family transcriptional regulator [Streptomyces kunmingensis]MEB3964319.1 AraC family transcriptional regulator [Streptomyces kunmingensis]